MSNCSSKTFSEEKLAEILKYYKLKNIALMAVTSGYAIKSSVGSKSVSCEDISFFQEKNISLSSLYCMSVFNVIPSAVKVKGPISMLKVSFSKAVSRSAGVSVVSNVKEYSKELVKKSETYIEALKKRESIDKYLKYKEYFPNSILEILTKESDLVRLGRKAEIEAINKIMSKDKSTNKFNFSNERRKFELGLISNSDLRFPPRDENIIMAEMLEADVIRGLVKDSIANFNPDKKVNKIAPNF